MPAKNTNASVKVAAKSRAASKAKPKSQAKPRVAAKSASERKVATPKSTVNPATSRPMKETTMANSKKVTEGLETMMSDAQSKAQQAFEKSSAMFGDYAEFAKGNVEAVVESGKIFAEGLQDLGTNLVSESRSVFETASSDVKEMAAAKSPVDVIQLQTEMVRKSFDNAVAYGSKNTEAVIKLVSEAFSPISNRVGVAVDKVRQTAL